MQSRQDRNVVNAVQQRGTHFNMALADRRDDAAAVERPGIVAIPGRLGFQTEIAEFVARRHLGDPGVPGL